MSSARPGNKNSPTTLDALLDRILGELRSPADTRRLEELRAAFRRKVPFHLRAYAAALLLDWRLAPPPAPREKPKSESLRRGKRIAEEQRQERERQNEEIEPRRLEGEGLTVFFGMGKRQRLYPRVLLRLLLDEAGLEAEEIGDIRVFDNYAFADLAPAKASTAIAALEGYEWKGRGIPVSLARKREQGLGSGKERSGADLSLVSPESIGDGEIEEKSES